MIFPVSPAGGAAQAILSDCLAALDLPPQSGDRVRFVGKERLPSCFPVSELANATIGAAGAALGALMQQHGAAREVTIDGRLAALWFGFSIRPLGWELPSPWDAIAGDCQARDGWIKLHTNAPHHRAAALRVLGCEPAREQVAKVVSTWESAALEVAVLAAGGCAAKLNTADAWRAHPQGQALATEPLIHWDCPALPAPPAWRPNSWRPLAGLRVLDLTRVLAGPVATRFLAGFGAEVLRIDPPDWDEPGVIPEVTPGKRCARLDLRDGEGKAALIRLLEGADILVHGYRRDALERLGLGAQARQAIRPGLIDISLNAYGHSGPLTNRRGFDSLVQFSTGIAADGMAWRGAAQPVSLPVQALDQATGYLLAAATIRAVIARLEGKGPVRARLSLARTAKLLMDHQGPPSDSPFAAAQDGDYAPQIEPTDWGPARRIKPPLQIDGLEMHWASPAASLGSANAEWQ